MAVDVRRRLLIAGAAALLLAQVGTVSAADKVRVGTVGNSSDAGFFIADAKGYFKTEGLDISFVPFDGAAQMMAPLGTGELDVGGGTASAGLYNAAARNIAIKVVADRSRTEPGYLFQTLMIRKALVDSGRFKSYADLKGLKIGIVAPGGSPTSTLNEAAKKGGVAYADIEKVYLAFPQQAAAFGNGAIDGSIMIEPFATALVDANIAVRFSSTEDFYPSDQIGVVFYSERFLRDRHDAGTAFMRAYVRAIRDYNDAVENGRFSGGKGDEIVGILAKYLSVKEDQIRATYTQAVDPDGQPNVVSLRKDLDFFKAQGDVTAQDITVDQILDTSFVKAAATTLGPYRPDKR